MGYVFISYSSMNQKEADIIKDYLKKQHINTWMAPENIPAGSRYAQVINKALKECACVVLLLTDEAQNSIWVDKEIERALNYRKTVIPIQIGELELNDSFEFYISTNQVITVQKVEEDSDEMEKVLSSVQKCVEKADGSINPWNEISLIGIGGCGCHTVGRLVESYFDRDTCVENYLKDTFIADNSR